MRYFIAVDLDEKLKSKIISLQNQLKGLDVRLVEENNLHFTLKFLGDVAESDIEKVKEILSETAATSAFEINLHSVGVFPDEKYIRVIWIGAENEKFINLHDSVNDALSKLFKKEKAIPHLTIARVRSGKDNAKIMDFVKMHRNIEVGLMKVDKIKLKKSTLTREGPVYEDIEEFELIKE